MWAGPLSNFGVVVICAVALVFLAIPLVYLGKVLYRTWWVIWDGMNRQYDGDDDDRDTWRSTR